MPLLSDELWSYSIFIAAGAVVVLGILHFLEAVFSKPAEARQYPRFVEAVKRNFPAVIWKTSSEVTYSPLFGELSLAGAPCEINFTPGSLEESYLKYHWHTVRLSMKRGLPGIFLIERRSWFRAAILPQILRSFGFKGLFGDTVIYSGDHSFDRSFEVLSRDFRSLQNIMSEEEKRGSRLFQNEISPPLYEVLNSLVREREFKERISQLLQGRCWLLSNSQGRVSVTIEFHTPESMPDRAELERVARLLYELTMLPIWQGEESKGHYAEEQR